MVCKKGSTALWDYGTLDEIFVIYEYGVFEGSIVAAALRIPFCRLDVIPMKMGIQINSMYLRVP